MEALQDRIEPQSTAQLRVGEWLVTPDLNQISRGDDVVHLEPKAMALLLHLTRRPGEVASRDELLAAVWPGVIVGDNALTQVVIKLRKALGDTAREPTYIQAISKKGYRLVAPVDRSVVERAAPREDQPAPPLPATSPTTRLAVAALAIVAIIGVAMTLATKRSGERDSLLTAEPAQHTAPSIVLIRPLDAIGDNSQQSLIARAITADLVNDLSKVSGLWVVRGMDQDLAAGSDNARTRYVVSGVVQGDGERLRLHVHLTDVLTGRQLWSQRFERDATDLFAVQDDLVREILAVLPVKVSEAETLRLAQRYTRNLEAYEYFLRGQAALLVRRPAQNERAREMYWKAIQSDPNFARAYAGLALTYGLEYQLGWAADGTATLSRALEFAKTATQMSPEMPEAHWALGFVYVQARQHADALRHLDSALRLNPSYADAHALKAGILTYLGRPAEGIPLLRTALRLNPDAGSLYFLLLGRIYYFMGDAEQARVNLEHALKRNAESLEARIYLAAVHMQAGERDAAEWQGSEIRAMEPAFNVINWIASYPMTDATQRHRLVASLQAIGL